MMHINKKYLQFFMSILQTSLKNSKIVKSGSIINSRVHLQFEKYRKMRSHDKSWVYPQFWWGLCCSIFNLCLFVIWTFYCLPLIKLWLLVSSSCIINIDNPESGPVVISHFMVFAMLCMYFEFCVNYVDLQYIHCTYTCTGMYWLH